MKTQRSIGAQTDITNGTCAGVRFRVWAPECPSVELVLQGRERRIAMQRDDLGYWSAEVAEARPGTRYHYALAGSSQLHPDPVSRFQPQGTDGPSEVVDPSAYAWHDETWRGLELPGQIIYELHVGTFTEAGTWDAARSKLPHLRELGVSLVELMPVAEFAGAFGWGYDGVHWFAPYHRYGTPDAFRAFVDEAHRLGIGVLLDVVYNHFGPAGNHLPQFSKHYFSQRQTDWGPALNFDGEHAREVRAFVVQNAAYWVREFHVDGLRLDATQSIHDTSQEHIVAELARAVRAAASPRSAILVAENEPQDTQLLRAAREGGFELDAIWNDDFHHSATVALVGHREAYYTDYRGRAHEFVAAARHGPLYQGQYYQWQKKRRGRSSRGIAPSAFVTYLDNHDQVANSARGERTWQRARPNSHRAMTALLLLGPWTPMLFQGQEWSSASPFLYFADHYPELATQVRKGRAEFLMQFPSLASPSIQERLPDPGSPESFRAAKLDWDAVSSERGQRSLRLHRDLLQLRATDPVVRAALAGSAEIDAAVLEDDCFAIRYDISDEDARLLIVNLGTDRELRPAPEPLLAPPFARRWERHWTSENPSYGGDGAPSESTDATGWQLNGPAAVLYRPAKES